MTPKIPEDEKKKQDLLIEKLILAFLGDVSAHWIRQFNGGEKMPMLFQGRTDGIVQHQLILRCHRRRGRESVN